jgi:hypothetical protein
VLVLRRMLVLWWRVVVLVVWVLVLWWRVVIVPLLNLWLVVFWLVATVSLPSPLAVAYEL